MEGYSNKLSYSQFGGSRRSRRTRRTRRTRKTRKTRKTRRTRKTRKTRKTRRTRNTRRKLIGGHPLNCNEYHDPETNKLCNLLRDNDFSHLIPRLFNEGYETINLIKYYMVNANFSNEILGLAPDDDEYTRFKNLINDNAE